MRDLGQQNGSIRPHMEHCPFEAAAIVTLSWGH
jgi:hypothetical protein